MKNKMRNKNEIKWKLRRKKNTTNLKEIINIYIYVIKKHKRLNKSNNYRQGTK